MDLIKDKFERIIDYMRISITDRCNLRCIFCMPAGGMTFIEPQNSLTSEEIIRIVRTAAGLGVKKIRLTGGEPLTRKDLPYLIESIRHVEGIEDISLTTNGQLLKNCVHTLVRAGLNRVNVSLDSLKPDRYREITRGGDIQNVFEAIQEAEREGLLPIKINMVPIKGVNDDEIGEFARLILTTPFHIRFIELMPIGPRAWWGWDKYVPMDEIQREVSALGPLSPVKLRSAGPARYFRFEKAQGVVGFISPISHHFCNSCNRLRITSDGKLRPCLFSESEIDLKSAMRSGASDSQIERLLKLSVEIKPKGHSLNRETSIGCLRSMSRIGG